VSDEPDFVLIGLVRRAHGTGGEVCVKPVSDIRERYDGLRDVLLRQENGIRTVGVDSVRWKGPDLLVKLTGVDDRTAAEALRGADLGVRRSDVFPLPEDTYYAFNIVGCVVIDQSGVEVGTVHDVLKMPANDVYVIETANGEVLIPAVRSIVKRVDPEARVIEIENIEGLLG
jgi:16S rRNA processing protein RimM